MLKLLEKVRFVSNLQQYGIRKGSSQLFEIDLRRVENDATSSAAVSKQPRRNRAVILPQPNLTTIEPIPNIQDRKGRRARNANDSGRAIV